MRSLRARLFVAILGVVLLAVGASLALGIVLTRDAVRETLRPTPNSGRNGSSRGLLRPGPACARRRLRRPWTCSAATSAATCRRC